MTKRDAEATKRDVRLAEDAAKRDAEAAKRDAEAAKRETRLVITFALLLGIVVATLSFVITVPAA